MRTSLRTRLRARRLNRTPGQSVVELAISMPLLLLLLLGTIDVGRVFLDYIEMRNAVVEGATFGARHPYDGGGIGAAVSAHGIPADTAVSSSPSGACGEPQGDGHITVVASRTFTPIFLSTLDAVGSGIDWSFDVRASSTMRCLT